MLASPGVQNAASYLYRIKSAMEHSKNDEITEGGCIAFRSFCLI